MIDGAELEMALVVRGADRSLMAWTKRCGQIVVPVLERRARIGLADRHLHADYVVLMGDAEELEDPPRACFRVRRPFAETAPDSLDPGYPGTRADGYYVALVEPLIWSQRWDAVLHEAESESGGRVLDEPRGLPQLVHVASAVRHY